MDAGDHIPDALVAVGQEIVATKHLSIACATILFYEYFLTFFDEVQYAWRGKKTNWVFLLFFMNRYLPIAYKIWDLSDDGQYQSAQLVTWNSEKDMSHCSVATFAENAYLVLVTLFSQLFLAMRVYALKGRDKPSFVILLSMTMVHFAYGIVLIAIFRREAFTYASLASLEIYTFSACLQSHRETGLQLGYLGLSLAFDVVAFFMIAAYSYQSARMFKASGLSGRVVQDATVYFLMIVWVHLTVTIYTSTMGDSRILRLFPTITNTIIPVMICRLILSLRKATDPTVIRAWNVDHFSTQIETRMLDPHGPHGVFLTPIRFNPPTATATNSGREVESEEEEEEEEEDVLAASDFYKSLAGRGWMIGEPRVDEHNKQYHSLTNVNT